MAITVWVKVLNAVDLFGHLEDWLSIESYDFA